MMGLHICGVLPPLLGKGYFRPKVHAHALDPPCSRIQRILGQSYESLNSIISDVHNYQELNKKFTIAQSREAFLLDKVRSLAHRRVSNVRVIRTALYLHVFQYLCLLHTQPVYAYIFGASLSRHSPQSRRFAAAVRCFVTRKVSSKIPGVRADLAVI